LNESKAEPLASDLRKVASEDVSDGQSHALTSYDLHLITQNLEVMFFTLLFHQALFDVDKPPRPETIFKVEELLASFIVYCLDHSVVWVLCNLCKIILSRQINLRIFLGHSLTER
jgi:hypothetical protein